MPETKTGITEFEFYQQSLLSLLFLHKHKPVNAIIIIKASRVDFFLICLLLRICLQNKLFDYNIFCSVKYDLKERIQFLLAPRDKINSP